MKDPTVRKVISGNLARTRQLCAVPGQVMVVPSVPSHHWHWPPLAPETPASKEQSYNQIQGPKSTLTDPNARRIMRRFSIRWRQELYLPRCAA